MSVGFSVEETKSIIDFQDGAVVAKMAGVASKYPINLRHLLGI